MNALLRLVTPTCVVRRVSDAAPAFLQSLGVDAVITDLDNTLVPWRRYEISQEVFDWIDELKASGIKIVIASNTMHPARLQKLAAQMDVPCVLGVRKPWPAGYRKSMAAIGASAERTAMLGDQIFTDILGANALKLRTILLRPALSRREFIWTVFVRQFEKLLVSYLQATQQWPEPLEPAKRDGAGGGSSVVAKAR